MKNVEDLYPLSPLQQGLLFHSVLEPASGVYVNQSSYRLHGNLDADVFRETWQRLVDRHGILRTAFVWEGLVEPVQAVRQRVRLPWRDEDWSKVPGGEHEGRLDALRAEERFHPFDLAKAPLARFVLVRLSDDEHEFVWTFHHILLDGWSTPLLLREVLALYAALSAGRDPELPPATRYRDYIAWLQRQDLAATEAFWRRTLEDFIEPTPLGIGRPARSAGGSTSEEVVPVAPEVTSALQSLAARRQVTLNTLVLGSWALLLARYSGEEDVLFGSVVSGRPVDLPGVESMVGLFINTLPVRVAVPGRQCLLAWLREIQTSQLELRQHEHSPLVQIQKWSRLPPGTRLFESLFVFENYPTGAQGQGGGGESSLRVAGVRSVESTGYPLTLAAWVAGDLGLRLSYDSDRFEPATAQRLLGHLAILLTAIAAAEDRPLDSLPLLSREEERQIESWNRTGNGWDLEVPLHALVEARVDLTPGAVAVSFAGTELTYRELDERANRLARRLLALGAGPEQRVALFLERSVELVVALLAVLKSGAAYLPLDPDHPAERLAFQADDSCPAALLTQAHLVGRLPRLAAPFLVVTPSGEETASEKASRPEVWIDPDLPAYVLYTSGSTGRPKGVAVPHRGIVNRLLWMQDAYDLMVADRVLQKTPYSFDVSVWEFFWPLLAGARLVVAPPGIHGDSARLVQLVRDEGITVMHFVPSMLRPFLEEPAVGFCRSLRDVMVSGEALPGDLAQRFHERLGARLHNLYGPTEAAVDVTSWTCRPGDDGAVPIGRPIANTRIRLLDPGLHPVPVGVPGEIYIGGVNLARGYFARPALTAERFVPDPQAGDGARLYRTGDLGRYREDGAIEYIDRIDNQVKVRGFRIELGEIEATLLTHVAVREAAVAAPRRTDGHRRLVAYVAGDALPAGEELRRFLLERLPEYMVPAFLVVLDRLPLSSNGKLDRRALPEPDAARPELAEAFASPEGEDEIALAAVWLEVLQVERVGRNDNFFALGGDSILSLQVLSKARERGLELSLQQIFQHPTIGELAVELRRGGEATPAPRHLKPFELLSDEDRTRLSASLEALEDAYPLALLQTGMLFHGELGTEASTYHNTVSVHLSAPLDLSCLDLALQRLASRHPLLRTSFAFTGFSEPLQLVHREVRIPLEVHDLRALSAAEQEAELDRWFEAETHRLFDWREAPLIRFHVHRRADDRFQLSWSEHHAILDGWSVAAMTAELGQDYLALLRQGPAAPQPPTATSRFRDFVALERQVLADPEARRFWLDLLRDAPLLSLPRIAERPPEPPRIVSLPVPLEPGLTSRVQALSNQAGVPLKNTLLAVHVRALSLASGQDDLVFGVVNNGRLEEADAERVFGLYLNTLPYRLRVGDGTWLDLVQQSFDMERAMLPFRRFPLAEIQRLTGGQPLFEVAFTYMNFHVVQGFAGTGGDMQTMGARNHVPTNFPLSVYFEIETFSSQLRLSLDYDASQLTAGQVQALAGYYQRGLAALVERPESRYAEESLLSDAERLQVLDAWNRTSVSYPEAGRLLHALIGAQAERTPDAPALAFEGERLTYRELETCGNRLARFLRRLGVGPDIRVGVSLERSFDLLVALYAVLKAGGAYVPLDPSYPADRLAFMAADAQAPVILTTRSLAERLPAGARLVLMDEEGSAWAGERTDAPPELAAPDHLAYVIYTSGSTGVPKGAMNSHRAVVNRLLWMQERYRLTPADRVLQKTPFSFDVSVWELFWPLLAGACLVVARPDGHRQSDYLAELIEREGVTVLHFVPSMLRAFLAEPRAARCTSIRQVCASGEALPPDLERRFFQVFPRTGLDNLYGPTEAAIDVTAWACDPAHPGPTVPIGHPIVNLQIYVLDRRLLPVPPGVPGEVYIGGIGLARGYHSRPGLTAERFLPHPWGDGARLYRTGDLGRHRPDGSIEYLGRLDHQVKLRGFRIELGEIEAGLRGHPAVRDCAVLLRDDGEGAHLVAYVVAAPEPVEEADTVGRELAGEQVTQWQMVFDQAYESGAGDPGFDISGWVSSYTGQPIPGKEMRDWVDSTVERIRALAPRSILEIGCGTGLLLSRLAPDCDRYWATDISAVAVERLRSRFAQRDHSPVRLFHRAADDFADLPEQSFDVVVLNSVVQYFPSADYLAQVLAAAVRAVRPGGFVFVGDVRSLPLHRVFHAGVAVEAASATTPVGAVRQHASARVAEDGELVLDPSYFTALAQRLPGVAGARLALKRGRYRNEMTLFRYDVVLLVGSAAPSPPHLELDGGSAEASLPALRLRLAADRPDGLLLRGLRNARLVREVRTAELLNGDESLFVGQLLDILRTDAEAAARAVDPEDVWELARETGYTADLSWSEGGHDGRFDAFLWRGEAPANRLPLVGSPPENATTELPWSAFANDPLRAKLLAGLVPRWRAHLLGSLPDYMVPSSFVLLEEIPLSPNGKLDRAALPMPTQPGPSTPTYVAPRTPVEETLVAIWQDVLRRNRIGIEDNLFEIGGHSLLATQIVVRIREAMQIDLPLRTLYAAPTVAALAVAVVQRQAELADAATLESLLTQIEQDGAVAEGTAR